MSYPTLTCKYIQGWLGQYPPAPTFEQFNQVWFINPDTDQMYAVWKCDPDYSTFVPVTENIQTLSNADFTALWPALIGLIVSGFLVKVLLRSLS